MDKSKILEQFRIDVAKFSGNYKDFLIIAKTDDQLFWKSTDDTWGVGAAKRYTDIISERDKFEENHLTDDNSHPETD